MVELVIGKEMEFLLETMENDAGVMTLSREKAMRMQGWEKIVKLSNDGTLVEGKPVKKVKGGFLVDIMGIEGFLPSSLSSFRNIADL